MNLSRRDSLRALGRVGLAVATGSIVAVAMESPALATQSGWRWCRNCKGLWFANLAADGGCCPRRRGLPHTSQGSGNYQLLFSSDPGSGQTGWRWCSSCKGLWYKTSVSDGGIEGGYCASSGLLQHTSQGSGNYKIELASAGGGQSNWRFCFQCRGLWFNDGSVVGEATCQAYFDNPGSTASHQIGSNNFQLRHV
ncbi:hypothetical protein GCM10009557_34270 [Virgisporangium ochraceum]|uniref:Uncharacterized protein n=1 Tax=Virgisporangium ochraceum TaxID=65505 RepID=A0A8J4A425_9ACTN|nr:hypothetical protein [Virgisporangium ochraceum]GIJ75437.1 hypothetical protein Voc01_103540 [Virgisporangium ochraceum]